MTKKERAYGLRNLISCIVAALLIAGLAYLLHPAMNFHNPGLYFFIVLCCILVGIAMIPKDGTYSDVKHSWLPTMIVLGIGALCLVILLIGWITTWGMFHSEDYRAIPDIEVEAKFDEDFPEVLSDGSNIPYVDLETARHIGDRTIGKINHASWYEVDDEYNLICYQGKYYRLSPLNYSGFFPYNKGKEEGIPGYVLVDAQTMSAEFVKVEGGYFYSPSAFFGKDLSRHLRSQFSNMMFDESNFEIDDEGHPYWVTAAYRVTVGWFGGYKEDTFVVTDAVTGNSEVYSVENLPEWVDHGIRLGYIMDTLDNYYRFVHGAFNFSKTDVYKTSYEYRSKGSNEDDNYDEPFAGYTSFVDSNGDVCFYTGLTPKNGAESNTGFLLIDCKTGAVKQYLFEENDGGIEESTAVERAESEVQNYGYQATFPMMVNIAGEPTYVMCLKGKDGLVKKVSLALVSTKASTIVVGDNLEDAIAKYEAKLVSEKIIEADEVEIQPENEEKTLTGKITEVYEVNIEGTTHFLYGIEGQSALFDSSIKLGYFQVKLEVGDTVTITYIEADSDVKKVTQIVKK